MDNLAKQRKGGDTGEDGSDQCHEEERGVKKMRCEGAPWWFCMRETRQGEEILNKRPWGEERKDEEVLEQAIYYYPT